MLVSFLIFGQISYFPSGRILVFILRIFGPIYRHVIPTFFSFDALIKLRVFISLRFLKELIELIGFLWVQQDLSIGSPSSIMASSYTKVLASI